MRGWFKLIAVGLTLSYPFWVYWGMQSSSFWLLILVMLCMVALRCASGVSVGERNVLVLAVIGVSTVMLIWGEQLGFKFYPVMINAGFLFLFASSLVYPPTFVERIAKLAKSEITPKSISYMRRVTFVWSLFFFLNGSIALQTAVWGSDEEWLLYNGFIAYLLIGILAGSEWLVRQKVMRN